MSSGKFATRDAEIAFATMTTASQLNADVMAGDTDAILTCRGIEVAYDRVQVLFGVDLDVRRGECVALLGTNGAGKSTVLNAISGIVDPIGGAIFFEGKDITHLPTANTAELGIVVVPGGKAVFPTLSVAEHLRAAAWLFRDDAERVATKTAEVYATFPRLEERIDQPAGNLSGGEQQMLALGMAFIAEPKLLIIDELSLGLAPTIVEQLLVIVRQIQATGTAIVLVEQSINVALTVADRAYFLEKGEVRFEGPTAELLHRDDIVRSVFLAGANQDTDVQPDHDGARRAGGTVAPLRVRAVPPASAPTVLELDSVTKRFGGITAVDDTSFVLREGEILGLIGANGAGKTTIFDIISGFLIPEIGRVTLDGVDITTLRPDQRAWLGLGRSFQDARLVPSLTVAENLALSVERHLDIRDHLAPFLGLPGQREIEKQIAWTVQDLIELMSLGAYRDKFVRELSTGSRRVADLAMCIAHDPKVLLLDEPAAGIAQKEAEALGPLLERIQNETGCALMLIEHDMPLITGVSDRMIALELGHPMATGTPDEVIGDPRVIASYLGGDAATINRSSGGADPAPGSPPPAADPFRRIAGPPPPGTARRSREERLVTRTSRLVQVVGAIAVLVGVTMLPSLPFADAASVDDAGWWDRNNGVPLGGVAPPAEGVLRVANDPTGPSAVAAIRIALEPGESRPVLVLRVTGPTAPAGAGFLACRPKKAWKGDSGGPWGERPLADCEKGRVPGVVAEDGTTVTFGLASLVAGGVVDVVIGPAADGRQPDRRHVHHRLRRSDGRRRHDGGRGTDHCSPDHVGPAGDACTVGRCTRPSGAVVRLLGPALRSRLLRLTSRSTSRLPTTLPSRTTAGWTRQRRRSRRRHPRPRRPPTAMIAAAGGPSVPGSPSRSSVSAPTCGSLSATRSRRPDRCSVVSEHSSALGTHLLQTSPDTVGPSSTAIVAGRGCGGPEAATRQCA